MTKLEFDTHNITIGELKVMRNFLNMEIRRRVKQEEEWKEWEANKNEDRA